MLLLYFLNLFIFFKFLFVVDFVIHWNETAMGLIEEKGHVTTVFNVRIQLCGEQSLAASSQHIALTWMSGDTLVYVAESEERVKR